MEVLQHLLYPLCLHDQSKPWLRQTWVLIAELAINHLSCEASQEEDINLETRDFRVERFGMLGNLL